MQEVFLFAVMEKEDERLNSYKQLLQREKYKFSNSITDATKVLITNMSIANKEISNFLNNGGIVFAENQKNFGALKIAVNERILISELHFEEYSLVNAIYPSYAYRYTIEEETKKTIGYFRTHEKRIIKHEMDIGKCPIIQVVKVGKGTLYLSSISFADYLNLNGSTLRSIKNRSTETNVSERVSQIDKGIISYFLKEVFKEILMENNLPVISFSYFPDQAEKVFIFRMDLDGIDDDHTIIDVAQLCEKYGIPGTFYANKLYMEKSPKYVEQILSIKGNNEVGNHGMIHNIYDNYEDNYKNIVGCTEWLNSIGISPTGFVAPRGIWNASLDKAISDSGFDYSSDFGLNFNDLPFRPYINDEPSKVLQIPGNPYCVGRAEIFKTEISEPVLDDEEILNYYLTYMNDQVGATGNGLVLIYGHPLGLGKRVSVLEKIFIHVSENNYKVMSIKQFKDWWILRESIDYTLTSDKSDEFTLHINDKFTPLVKICNGSIKVNQ